MAAGDPTRVHGVRAGERVLMPGLTRPEAEAACGWLARVHPGDRSLALAEVALPVVLSDGAGPHLLDAGGALVLALGPHPSLPGARMAMGAAPPRYVVGLVRAIGDGGWIWVARAEVDEADRVAALDELDAVEDRTALSSWAAVRAGVIPIVGM